MQRSLNEGQTNDGFPLDDSGTPDASARSDPSGTTNDSADDASATGWTFLTNHAHVLICLTRNPTLRIRDLAAEVGITERSVQGIIGDLEEAGCLLRIREGRRNRYEVMGDVPMRHQVECAHTVGELLEALGPATGRVDATS